MIVTDIKTFVVGNPPPRYGGRYFLFLKLTTDSGIHGYGEVYTATFSPHLVAKMIEDVAERHVIGQNPFHIEKMWRQIYGRGYASRPDLTLGGIMSGLEMACWDVVGKECNKPVYELLGGRVHEKLRTYTYLYPANGADAYADDPVYSDPHAAAAAAVAEVERGFTAVKFDPAGSYGVFDPRHPSLESIDRSVRMIRAVREAVGTRADLLIGTHGQFTVSGAIRYAQAIAPFDPLWFEEPTPPENPEAMALVAQQSTVPIATGERLVSKYEFARVLQSGAASILQLNLGRCGGLLEGKKIAALAETYYTQIAPHLYCGPIVGAANIQLSTCSPNFLILEGIQDWAGFHARILKKPIQWEDGYVIPSAEPGLGVELDEEVALAHPYIGTELHLEPTQTPIQ
jgi:galactonate dehydratase